MENDITFQHQKKRKSSLRDIILGGQDGLVNVLGLTLGLFAAQAPGRLILIAGLAAGLSEALSMGAVAYTSALADRDFYLKAKELELKEIGEIPKLEKQEMYNIFYEKGFRGKLLDQIIQRVTGNKELWVKTIVADELNLRPVENKGLVMSALVVGLSALIGSLIPLVFFIFLGTNIAILCATIISAILLFAVGAYKAITLVGVWWKSGLQMLVIGMLSAFAGFFIGLLLKVH